MALGAALTLALFVAACGAAPGTPTPPGITFGFQVLVDLGLFDGFPNVPPPYVHRDLPDGTSIVVVDRGGVQQVRHVERDGERWRSLGGFDRPMLPDGPGPLLAAVPVGPDDGFDEELLLLVGRFPNGPINQLELAINGAAETVAVEKPITVHPFPAGTDVGPTYTTLDAATKRLGVEPVLAGD